MAKKNIPKLLVIFDTNVLYTQVASELIRNDVQRIIIENSEHPDLKISWYLPNVVIGERKYQMLEKAKELLPNMKKLEKLLGHAFGVGEDTLELHVDNAIQQSVDKYNLLKLMTDVEKIDWNDIIFRSVSRLPPFDTGEKEKGFRDSLIANSFFQLHKDSPKTPNICLIALVSEDKLLREYALELSRGTNNIRVLSTLDELENLINTLVSTIPEELASQLAKKAKKIFFEDDIEKNFYNKENIQDKINELFPNKLNDPIDPDCSRTNGTWWISEPIFKKKEKQKIYWISPVEVDFEIYSYEQIDNSQSEYMSALANLLSDRPKSSKTQPSKSGLQALLDIPSNRKKVVHLEGKEKFEVNWSVNLTRTHNLTSPKLENIEYSGNDITETH